MDLDASGNAGDLVDRMHVLQRQGLLPWQGHKAC